MSELKNSPDGVNNRLDFAEGIEDIVLATIRNEAKKEYFLKIKREAVHMAKNTCNWNH